MGKISRKTHFFIMDQALLEEVKNKVTPLLVEQGVELVELTEARERGRPHLRLLVTKSDGITLDECARLNQRISQILDREDIIQESYILEVSSPGLNRPLISTRDFQRCLEKPVRIVLHKPINGQNVYQGLLNDVSEENIIIYTETQQLCIPRGNIARARQELDFA